MKVQYKNQNMLRKVVKQHGFTLIELMVVLAIIAGMAALIVPNLMDSADEGKITSAKVDVSTIGQALDRYKLDNQTYPSTEQGLISLVERPSVGNIPPNWKQYIKKLPTDPWGRPYQYLNPGVKNEVDVMSFGADGVTGGDGKNADIGTW